MPLIHQMDPLYDQLVSHMCNLHPFDALGPNWDLKLSSFVVLFSIIP